MHRRARWLAPLVAVLAIGVVVDAASATNVGSESGDETDACAVSWNAETVMDTDLTDGDPTYPNLMTDLNGQPTDYSNGGYITEVRPEYGDSGMFEINHWYGNTASPTAGTSVNWRLPISTDHLIHDATVTVTLPGPGSGFVFDGVSTNARMSLWGTPYSTYTWSEVQASAASTTDGLTWTVDLGDLPAGTGHVFQFTGTVPAGTALTAPVVATADLTGTYDVGTLECRAPTSTTTTTVPASTTTSTTVPASSTTTTQPGSTSTTTAPAGSTTTVPAGPTATTKPQPGSATTTPARPVNHGTSTWSGTHVYPPATGATPHRGRPTFTG